MTNKFDVLDEVIGQPAPAAAAPGKFDVLDKVFADDQQRADAALQGSLSVAVRTNPDEFGKAKALAQNTGLPVDVAQRNRQLIEQQERIKELKRLSAFSPVLAQQLADPNFARLAHDDGPNAAAAEAATKSIGQRLIDSPYALMKGLGGTYNQLAGNVNTIVGVLPIAWDYVSGLVNGKPTTEAQDEYFRQAVQPLVDRQSEFALDKGAGVAEKVSQGLGGALGFLSEMVLSGGTAEAPAGVGGVQSLRTILAKATEHAVKSAAMPAVSDAVTAGREVFAQTGDPVQAIKAAVAKYGATTVAAGIPASAPGNLVKRILTAMGMAPGATEIARHIENAGLPDESQVPAPTPSDVVVNAIIGGVLGVAGPRGSVDAVRAHEARADVQKMGEAMQIAQTSKVRERDPDGFANFINEAAKEGADHVYVEAKEFANALNQAGLDPMALSPTAARELPDALRSGGDVRIPLGELMARAPGSGVEAALLPHLRTSEDAWSGAQADAYLKEHGEALRAEAEQVLAEKKGDTEFADSAGRVHESILKDLNAVNHFTPDANKALAAFPANIITTLAARHGILPEEMAKRYPLAVRAESLVPGGLLEQAAFHGSPFDHEVYRHAAELASQRFKSAVDEMLQKRSGEAPGVLKHPELGPIDLVWGKAGTPQKKYTDGFGLAHILVKHPEIDPRALDRIVAESQVAHRTAGHVRLESPKYHSVIKLDWHGKAKQWLLTSYEIKPADGERIGATAGAEPASLAGQEGLTKPKSKPGGELQQSGVRGSIQFGDDIKHGATITLLKDADLSTFLHEVGHYYLEVLHDLAEMPDAPEDVVADRDALMKWFGVTPAQWDKMSLDERRDSHEKLAHGVERYLFEGKAPSLELQPLFARFRTWLLSVYRSLTALKVELTPEVRGVFDRMLATKEQIAAAESARNMRPSLESAEQAGMTPEQWRSYQEQGQRATEIAEDELQARSLRDMRWLSNAKGRELKKLQADATAKRKEVELEVTHEVRQQPVYAVQRFITKGELPDGLELDEPSQKISIPALKEMYGDAPDAPWKALPRNLLASEGVHPDIVASQFHFASAEDMVAKIAAAPPEADVIRAESDRRTLERYGDLNNPKAIERAAEEAIHNEARARFVATEANALAKAVGKPGISTKVAKEIAAQIIARKRVMDVKPGQYAAAAARAGRAAEKGSDLAEKASQKRNQLINIYAAKAAHEALDQVDRGVRYASRMLRKAAQSNMRGESLAQLNSLLARFDLRSSLSRKEVEARKQAFADWVKNEASRLDAAAPDLPEWVLDDNYRKSYEELSLEDFRGLIDSVRQLEHLARREQKQYKAIREMNFEQESDAVVSRIREFHPAAFDKEGKPIAPQPDFVPSMGKKIGKLGEQFVGEFLSPETIANILEGGNLGQVHESLFKRMSDASTTKATLLKSIADKLKPLIEQYSIREKYDFTRKDIGSEIGIPLTRQNAVMVALLYGNREGRARLANYGWNDATLQKIIDLLDAKDMRLVDGLWRFFDEDMWPQMRALNERTRGIAPPKVESMPYRTRHGEARGGYGGKLKYDSELDQRVHNIEEGAAVKALLGNTYGMGARTNQGTSAERVDNVTARPRLDLGVISETINETAHDLAFREAVADTMRMLNDRGVEHSIKGVVGQAGYDALRQKVYDTASPPWSPAGFIEKAASIARRNTVVNMLSGFNTALQNFTGFVPAMGRVNPGLMAREIARFFSPSMVKRYRFVMEQSEFMRNYFGSFDRDVKNAVRGLVDVKLKPDTNALLWLMGMINRAVAVPTWNAAFAEGMSKFANDHAKAVEYADHIIRQTQGSGREVDLPAILQGRGKAGELKALFTMFKSYMISQLGQLIRAKAIFRSELERDGASAAVGKFTARFLAFMALPSLLTTWLFSPNGEKNEDNVTSRYLGGLFRYGAGMFPVLGDLAVAAWNRFDRPQYGYKLSPVESAGSEVVESVKSLSDLFSGEGDDRDVKHMIMGMGYILGLPGKLISDVVLGTEAWISGDAGPEAIVYGPPRKQ